MKNLKQYTLTTLLLLFTVTSNAELRPVEALEHGITTIDLYQSPSDWVLHFKGFLSSDEVKGSFVSLLDQIPENTNFRLAIESPGGTFDVTFAVLDALHRKCNGQNCKITTYVPSGRQCASNCIILLMGGHVRMMGEKSFLGFHAVSDSDNNLHMAATTSYMQELLRMGVDYVFLNRMWINKIFHSQEIHFVDVGELANSKIITQSGSISILDSLKGM